LVIQNGNVFEELTASIFKAGKEEYSSPSAALKMEAVSSSETFVTNHQ